jgi:hypothetical protein
MKQKWCSLQAKLPSGLIRNPRAERRAEWRLGAIAKPVDEARVAC